MTEPGLLILAAAQQLVGVRFRLHGRDPRSGLDCLGVVKCALDSVLGDVNVPQNYTLRQRAWEPMLTYAAASSLRDCCEAERESPRAGDVLLFEVGPAQCHLAISDGRGSLVHAHAGLSRVVFGKPDPDWRLLHHWRLRPDFFNNR